MLKIEDKWDVIKKAITQAVLLVSSFGYSRDSLKSNYALIPIAYYLMTIGLPTNFIDTSKQKANRAVIKKWLIRSLLKKAFSGQPDSVLRPIREILRNNGNNDFPFDEIVERFKGTNKSISFTADDIDDYLVTLRYGKPDTLSTLMLLYPSLDFKNIFHVDHIYPKSKFTRGNLSKEGIDDSKIDSYIYAVNSISNLQLLPATPNEEKNDTDFDVWFNSEYPTSKAKASYRDINYIPDMSYGYKDFLDFINERQKLISKELKNILL